MSIAADNSLMLAHKGLHSLQLSGFERGRTPLSTFPEILTALGLYLITIFSIKAFMRDRPPFKLQFLFRLHNFMLTAGSGALLSLIVTEVATISRRDGFFGAMCYQSSWTPRLELYYMINYGFKYVELIDTVFLALKKKPLTFLHVYHHSATVIIVYLTLKGKLGGSWLPAALNLAVHVFMYYYYYATAGGAKIWWKKHLTSMQITQFLIILSAALFGLWQRIAFNGYVNLPFIDNCTGSVRDVSMMCLVIASYLVLFIDFYKAAYDAGAKAKGGRGARKAR